MEVIGFRASAFTGNDGTEVKGVNIYCAYPVSKGGQGMACERLYLTEKKLEDCGYVPSVGDTIEVTYNKFGKVASIGNR